MTDAELVKLVDDALEHQRASWDRWTLTRAGRGKVLRPHDIHRVKANILDRLVAEAKIRTCRTKRGGN